MHDCVHWNVPVPAIVEGMHEAEDLLSHLTNCKICISFVGQLIDKCVFTLDNEM